MKRHTVRTSAAAVMTAIALGLAAPAASASEDPHAEVKTSVAVTADADSLTAEADSLLTPSEARDVLASPKLRAELTYGAILDLQAVVDGSASTEQQRSGTSAAAAAIWKAAKKAVENNAIAQNASASEAYTRFINWINSLPEKSTAKIVWDTANDEPRLEVWEDTDEQTD
ncbi:hypothetical protein [Streptomyces sp. MS2.AVA.5]|uniref:Uncharacterized protein n=1 Tax=Streptomyces achmelvichensis TaxID=3134111 RepID=A0ACC6Q8E1_9ACTN